MGLRRSSSVVPGDSSCRVLFSNYVLSGHARAHSIWNSPTLEFPICTFTTFLCLVVISLYLLRAVLGRFENRILTCWCGSVRGLWDIGEDGRTKASHDYCFDICLGYTAYCRFLHAKWPLRASLWCPYDFSIVNVSNVYFRVVRPRPSFEMMLVSPLLIVFYRFSIGFEPGDPTLLLSIEVQVRRYMFEYHVFEGPSSGRSLEPPEVDTFEVNLAHVDGEGE